MAFLLPKSKQLKLNLGGTNAPLTISTMTPNSQVPLTDDCSWASFALSESERCRSFDQKTLGKILALSLLMIWLYWKIT
jgi:hypothetical protein